MGSKASFRGLVGAALILLLCALAAVGYTLWKLREAALADAARDAGNVAQMLAEQTLRSIQAIDVVLHQVESEFELVQLKGPDDTRALAARPAFQALLLRHLNILSQADVITVIGADGRALATTRAPQTLGVDMSDGAMFRALRDGPDQTLIFSDPWVSRVTGRPTIYFGRRFTYADGSFAGGAVVGVELTYFNRLFRAIEAQRGMSTLLAHAHGRVLAGTPGWRESGEPASDAQAWRKALTPGGGTFLEPDEDGMRLVAVHEVPGHPLAVATAVDQDAILDLWRERASYIALGTTILLLIALGLLAAFVRQYRALEASAAGLRAKEAELALANRNFAAALENLPLGVCLFDGAGRVVVYNTAYRRMYGLEEGELAPGATIDQVIDLRLRKGLYAAGDALAYRSAVLTPVVESNKVVRQFNDGRVLAVSRLRMPGGARLTLHEDVTDAHAAQENIRRLAERDALTQLANRGTLARWLDEARARLAAAGEPFAVMIIDLDDFKGVNDTRGHAVGDQLLKALAARLAAVAGDDALLARFGGDEFVVLLRDAAARDLPELAGRLIAALREPCRCDGHDIAVGGSIGVFVARTPEDGAKALQRADLALYRAKQDGRNGWRAFTPDLEHETVFRRQIETDLQAAIDADALDVVYQPIVRVATGAPVGAEALLRWSHPTLGPIGPARFVPIAEERGLIGALGAWVLRRACAQARDWPDHLYVSVNISARQFEMRDVAADVRAALAAAGLPPRRLALEITETLLLERSPRVIAALEALRADGVSVKLDDFGAGYSSLAYLRQFRFDAVKIDRFFIAEIETRDENAAIVRAIADLTRALDVKLIAEGVETEAQRAKLVAAGCEFAQGFLFSRPAAVADLPSAFRTPDERAA